MFTSEWNLGKKIQHGDYIFVLHSDSILLHETDSLSIPEYENHFELFLKTDPVYFGRLNGKSCFFTGGKKYSEEFELTPLRTFFLQSADPFEVEAAGTANILYKWHGSFNYCPKCASVLEFHSSERAKICPSCKYLVFTPISPAVITLIIKRGTPDKILLAYNSNFKTKTYALIAGFVDPGESLEKAVQREIAEEVSIEVENIRYYSSQFWPFPNSLMIRFTAEYKSGTIKPDGVEIADAGWYSADDLPLIPQKGSISRRLIDSFLSGEFNT